MLRWPLLVVCALLGLAACGEEPPAPKVALEAAADFGPAPQRVEFEGAPASVQPPAGTWLVRTDRPGPERWTEQYRREADGVVLQAAVFPVQTSRHPSQALPLVIDGFVRSLGTDGFGQQNRGGGLLLGAPAAWSGFVAVVDGKRMQGRARIVLADDGHWALALGMAPDAAGADALALVASFATSLQPSRATFYARRFVDPAVLAGPAIKPTGESAVSYRDLAAVQLVLELASGMRFPLAVQPTLLRSLSEEASQGAAASRASFREVGAALAKTATMAPAEREAGMRALGVRILEQIFNRALEGYAPANQYRLAWEAMGRPVVGDEKTGISSGAAQSLHEMSAFLASLAADREVPTSEALGQAVVDGLKARFDGLDADARADGAQTGATWARLRYAWDHAERERRVAFRRAVLTALVAEADRPAVEALADEAAVLAWMHQHAADGPAYARRAAVLGAAQRTALFAILGVEASGHHVGW